MPQFLSAGWANSLGNYSLIPVEMVWDKEIPDRNSGSGDIASGPFDV